MEGLEGNALETEKLAAQLMKAYRKNYFAWMNIEYNYGNFFQLKHVVKLIEEAKHPIKCRLRELNKFVFEIIHY
jgi:hypothetical protein